MTAIPRLEWVVHEDAVVHVGRFASIPTGARPRVTCPVCGEEVIPHLGPLLRYHAAHRASSHCHVSTGESALHLNVKYHIASALRAAVETHEPLIVVESCEEQGCDAHQQRAWLGEWEEVRVEHRVGDAEGARIPDIVLRGGSRDVAAIEVRASNKVSAEKEQALARLAIPFVEVRADASLVDGEVPWSVSSPLPILRESGHAQWRCERHVIRRERTVLYAARVVDVLYGNGMSLRHIYRIEIHYLNGTARIMELACGDDSVARAAIREPSEAGSRRDALNELLNAYESDLESYHHRGGAIIDSPMNWAHDADASALMFDAASKRGQRWLVLRKQYPRRYRYLKPAKHWWLPPDMVDVHWNREGVGRFDEHSVLRVVRESARQRYRSRGASRDDESVSCAPTSCTSPDAADPRPLPSCDEDPHRTP